jgi:glycosyltransferase involved in cell wall biosynthesis
MAIAKPLIKSGLPLPGKDFRLLIISGFWPRPENPITGMFVVQQAEAYAALGCEVTVVAPQIPWRMRRRPYCIKHDPFTVFSPVYPHVPQRISGGARAVSMNKLGFARAVLKTLEKKGLPEQFDGIHLHGFRYAGLSLPLWKSRIHGPKVLTVHGIDPFLKERSKRLRLLENIRQMLQFTEKIVLVGRSLKSYTSSLGVPAEKQTIISNGTNLPLHYDIQQRSLENRRVILSISNLTQLKGIDINLHALSCIRKRHPKLNWHYRIVGDGPERGRLEALSKNLHIDDRVSFLGRLRYETTMREMEMCDIFSLPSWGEAFGIVYLEAMARGRPVIGCRHWGAEEIVRHGVEGLLVAPRDEAELSKALFTMLADPGFSSELGRAARDRAKDYTWEKNAEKYIKLFSANKASNFHP